MGLFDRRRRRREKYGGYDLYGEYDEGRRSRKRGGNRAARGKFAATRASMMFFLAFTLFMAVNLRSRLHPRALRGWESHGRFFNFVRPTWTWIRSGRRSTSGSSTSTTTGFSGSGSSTTAKRNTMPVNWHALAAQRAALAHGAGRKHTEHNSDASSGFSFSTLGLGVDTARGTRGVNVSKAAWDILPEREELLGLNRTDLPWVHRSGAAPTAPPLERASSIFAALRKGPWMGCSRANAMVCTGVYRALKRSAATSIFDVDCARHLAWLPKVMDKLLGEYRLVRVICAFETEAQHARAVQAWSTRRHVRFVRFIPPESRPGDFASADVTIARETLRSNLILAMRFLKQLKAAQSSKYLIHENFPRERMNVPTPTGLKINMALPPFSLPPPFYSHSDADDVFGVQVSIRYIEEMFEMRTTPTMEDLVDPRKRRVLE